MSRRSIRGSVLGLACALAASTSVDALNVPTHRLINIVATGNGSLDQYANTFDQYLRETLGLANGRQTPVPMGTRRSTAEEWLAEGGEREDDGSWFSTAGRFFRHFHNPLLPWDQAGLRTRYPFFLLPHLYTSSVHWMQMTAQAQDDGGALRPDSAWQDARLLHFRALTTSDPTERAALTATLFRTLGQLMHLVVDASVPEHVRNDPHPSGTFSREIRRRRTATNYEYWVSDEQRRLGDAAFTARYLSAPIGVDSRIFQILPPLGDTIATVPVARLIDADRYLAEAPDPNTTLSGTSGIAEVANANFFSEDTLLGGDTQGDPLPFPRRDTLVVRPDVLMRRTDQPAPGANVRRYFAKPAGDGLPNSFALAECRLDGIIARVMSSPYPCMDEAVWHQTASAMLPRAVGYARGVLDYFFRGSLRVHQVLTDFSGAYIEIENSSPEAMEGTFEVYARPAHGTPQERRERVARVSGGAVITLLPGERRRLPLSLEPVDTGIPSQVLVFRGRLGLEQDAVVGRVFDVPYARVVQREASARISQTCSTGTAAGRCDSRITRQDYSGQLTTNMPTPVIERVAVVGTGATLELDGISYGTTGWQRHAASAPDPGLFVVHWTRLTTSSLPSAALSVTLSNGVVVITRLVGFDSGVTDYDKFLYAPKATGAAYLVTFRRQARLALTNLTASGFVGETVGGVTSPTLTMDDLRYGRLALQRGLDVRSDSYLEAAVDVFDVFGDQAGAQAAYAAISIPTAPHPGGPFITWAATLRQTHTWPDVQLAFLRAFVSATPEASSVTLSQMP